VRLDAQTAAAHVTAEPGTARPIRLRLGPFRFSMSREEAIALASELVTAVDKLDKTGPSCRF
jgi:hypothetical protein